MNKVIATLILFFTLSVIASAAEPYNREPEPLPTKKWKTITVEMPFKQVVRIINKKTIQCLSGAGFIGSSWVVVPWIDTDNGEAEFYTQLSTMLRRSKHKLNHINIYALTNDLTQLNFFGPKKFDRKINGWLNGSEKCNGKLPKGSDVNS